jgi:hypothetical protein
MPLLIVTMEFTIPTIVGGCEIPCPTEGYPSPNSVKAWTVGRCQRGDIVRDLRRV